MRMAVKRFGRLPEIVGADHRRVAPGIAAAEPALLEHGDIRHAMLLGHVVGRGEAMAAGPDDHHVIGRFGLRRAPLLRPMAVAARRLGRQIEEGKFHEPALSEARKSLRLALYAGRRVCAPHNCSMAAQSLGMASNRPGFGAAEHANIFEPAGLGADRPRTPFSSPDGDWGRRAWLTI